MNASGSKHLRYDENDIDDSLIRKNQIEINESIETKERCVQELRRELKNLDDLEPCLDEDFLLRFLRVSKYETSKALQRIIKYYQKFDGCLNIYKKIYFPLHEAEIMKNLTLSPYRCEDNSFLLIGKGTIDYKRYTMAEFFYLSLLALHEILENPVNQICGGTFIFDYEGLDIYGYLAITPFWVHFFVDSLLNAFPCRLKAVHVVNMPSFFPLILKIAYTFLPKKLQNRVFLYSKKDDWKNMHALIPPDILPEKYGGKLKKNELIDCHQDLKKQEEKFLKLFAFGNFKTKKARQSFKMFL